MSSKVPLEKIVRLLLLTTAFAPLVAFRTSLFYPYVWGKTLFLRGIIEAALILFLIAAFLLPKERRYRFPSRDDIKRLLVNPLSLTLLLFLVSAALSTLFAVNPYHAFFGDAGRGDGFLTLAHFLVFFVLSVLLFRRGDWLLFFKLTVIAGAVSAFYAYLQYFNVQNFPFALPPTQRPGSFFDNPALFSTYLLWVLASVGILWSALRPGEKFFRYGTLGVAVAAVSMIFLTDVRGALVGLAAGVFSLLLFLGFRKSSRGAAIPRLLLSLGVLSLAIFVFTRSAPFWQNIPGLGRLSTLGVGDRSFETRRLALGSSAEALKGKPILGWGLENYNVAYNAHYNPRYAAYEEAWFDRAHNKPVEVAVTQGFLGVFAYLGIFTSLFFLLFKRNGAPLLGSETARFSAAAGLIAYFVQNLFLFDSPISYLMLYAVLGMVLGSRSRGEEEEKKEGWQPRGRTVPVLTAWAVILVTLAAFYLYLFTPLSQSRLFHRVFREKVGEKVLAASPRFLKPYNYLQKDLRLRFAELMNEQNILRDPQFSSLVEKAVQALEETAERDARYEPRNFIILGEIYNERSKDDPALFRRAEEYLRRALTLAPRRQDVYYHLAFSLSGQNRFEDAIRAAREAVDLSPEVARAHYVLGLILTLSGRAGWDEAYEEFLRAEEIGLIKSSGTYVVDVNNLSRIYQEMLYAYILERDRDRVVKVAKSFKAIKPVFADDLDNIIRLAGEGSWDTIIKAIKGE